MKDIIVSKLKEIEESEKVKIILAVESGSRAWGFESKDSDYDVRFIYVRQLKDYLRVDSVRDVIEWQLDDVLDINGWDLKKSLGLMYKSNPTLYEWFSSPIIYKISDEFDALKLLSRQYFSPKKVLYHYYHMALSNYKKYLTKDFVNLKKYFYVLRPLLAGDFILMNLSVPPMRFESLIEHCLPCDLSDLVYNLLERKKSSLEMDYEKRIPELDFFIENKLTFLKSKADSIIETKKSWDSLNNLFFNIVTNL